MMDSGVMTPDEWAHVERMIMENRAERERLNKPGWLDSLGERRADADANAGGFTMTGLNG